MNGDHGRMFTSYVVFIAGAALSGTVLAHHEEFRASELIGSSVITLDGEEVGEVEDLVVGRNDELAAVISVGGFLDPDDKLIVVSEDDLEFSHEEQLWQVNMTRFELSAKPEFEDKSSSSLDRRGPSGSD